MVREAVVVSATHGGLLYLLIHCSIAQWASILINTPNTPIGQKTLISPTVHWRGALRECFVGHVPPLLSLILRGALRERFVGLVPPLQLWQLVLTACLVATAVVLIAAGP